MVDIVNFTTHRSNENRKRRVPGVDFLDEEYRMLIAGPSGSGKTNILMNILRKPLVIYDQIYLYTKNPHQEMYQDLQKIMQRHSQKFGCDILHIMNPDEILDTAEYPEGNRKRKKTESVPGSERHEIAKNGRPMIKSTCAECGITKVSFAAGKKNNGGSLNGGSLFDVGNSYSLGEMALKGLANVAQQGVARAVKSDFAKNKSKKTADKYVNQVIDSFSNDLSKKISGGSFDVNQVDVNQVLPMSMYAPDGVNDPTHPLYEGGSFDIHKAIGKLPKPKSGWTLPGHKYTGPYNNLEQQVRYDPNTGKILEIFDKPTGPTDAVAMQHDVDYSVCGKKGKNLTQCKNAADRKMVKALDAIPAGWQEELADELHKPVRRNFRKRRVIVNGIDEIWCSDLVEMQKFAKWNKGYRYLLMVLDVFSKYGWIVPLKNKKSESVAEGFEKIFTEGRVPKRLWVDKGSEYYNSHVKDLMKSKGVEMYSTENEEKASVCERWNRTIKTDMWKQFTIQSNTQYLDILPRIVEKYNNRKHRSIGMTPTEASKKKNENAVFLKLYSIGQAPRAPPNEKPKFAVGDHVRISKFKRKVFDKGFTPNWTEEIFVVDQVQYSDPITYKLKDLLGDEIKGSFYEQEMLRAKQEVFRIEKVIRKSKGKALVKWSGYPEKFNSWIDVKDLQGV
ncbi:putative uncharacterized transposon-derived protein F54H12.3 [Stylophora pistillata]|uniref:Uncharacterized transposon-derived protein F54H12.3 n=1 Tax=Stylophora pistillata TaxID=50429 RepID=A0A2B4R1R5_STYPI|nr:putative uncharacterized transposon-derived protein F54H12.3 [Stylophora pistillata]